MPQIRPPDPGGGGLTAARRFGRFVAETAGYRSFWLARKLYLSPNEQETARREAQQAQWYAHRGDQTLRLDYPLDAESLVFDVGAYEGHWAADVFCRFGCRIELFEPVPEFAERAQERFARNSRIGVHQFGLGGADAAPVMHVERGASSIRAVPHESHPLAVEIRDIAGALEGAPEVDLVKVNIEGGEYELLGRLLETGLVSRFRFIQVQFHDSHPGALAQMGRLQEGLDRTHDLSWRYPLVWESWVRRGPPAA